MDNNQIGDHAEVYTILQLMERGYRIAIPYGNTKGIDLLVETRCGKWKKVQVKKVQRHRNGYRIHLIRGNAVSKRSTYNSHEFDFLIAVMPEEEKLWIVPYKEAAGKSCLYPTNRKPGWHLLR